MNACVKWLLARVKKHEKLLNLQTLKVVAVAYRRWSCTRDSNCKALTGKVLVVIYERCSQIEVQLFNKYR